MLYEGTRVKIVAFAIALTMIIAVLLFLVLPVSSGENSAVSLSRNPLVEKLQIRPPTPPPPPPVKVSGFDYSINEGMLILSLELVLPNPCYRIEAQGASLEDGKIVLNAIVTPPWSGTVCIQVLKAVSLSYEMPLPPPGKYPAYLRLFLKSPLTGIPSIPYEIFLGTVVIPESETDMQSQPTGPGVEPSRYQGLLLELVREWEGAPGFWLYKARVQGLGEALVALPLEITGGLPAGFAGVGYVEVTDGNVTTIILAQASVFK